MVTECQDWYKYAQNIFSNFKQYVIFVPFLVDIDVEYGTYDLNLNEADIHREPDIAEIVGLESAITRISTIKCNTGEYLNDLECQLCPVHHYCPTTRQISPVPCQEGSYQPKTGARFCEKCPTGAY